MPDLYNTVRSVMEPVPPSMLYVVSWDYYENANRLEGGGGGQEWRMDLAKARQVFEWALSGWGDHPCTIRLTAIPASKGMRWVTDDKERLTEAVSEALDLIEQPDQYDFLGWTLLAECRLNGGAS